MSRNETVAMLLGVCLGLAACNDSTGDLAGPEAPAPIAEAVTQVAPRADYITINLSKRPGIAYGINDVGQAVGDYHLPDNSAFHGFVWRDGVLRDIGTLGGNYSQAYGINNAGQVVGTASIPGDAELYAFLWQNGTMRNLGSLGWNEPIGEPVSVATSINYKAQVVGWSFNAAGDMRAFIWEAGTMRPLAGLENVFGKAHGLNNTGRVAGEYGDAEFSTRGFRWNGGSVSSIAAPGASQTVAQAINSENKVVGWSRTATGSSRAFLWRSGVMTDLGTLGGNNSEALAINNLGQIAGGSAMPSGAFHAFIWKDGVMYDVGPGAARGINRNAWIVGQTVDPALTGHTGFVPTLWKPGTPPPPPAAGLVRVGNNFFASARNKTYNPAVDTVAVGRTVTWDWFGGTHSVQSTGSPSFTSSAVMTGSQSEYKRSFTTAGTYQYNCVRHPTTMRGRIIVR